MLRTLVFITLRQWRIHKLRTALTLLGIALGVAVYFAVRTANVTLIDSLNVTVEKISGRATLQVTAGEAGFPEEILETVRATPGVVVAEPVIEVIAHTAFPDEGNLLIAGVDTTGDQEIREYQWEESESEVGDPLVYLAQPDSISVSRAFAERHGLKEEDKLPLYTSQGRKEFTVRGIFKPTGLGEVFGGNVAVMDVYSAQFVFNRGRNFDRIDMMTDPKALLEQVQAALRQRLPSGYKIERPAARGEELEKTVAVMRQGFTVTSFIALLVGVFIIFNSFSIAVNQRWKEIGILRALGVERRNVQRMFLGEAVLMGVIGSLLGVAAGFYMASGAAQVVSEIAAAIYAHATTPQPPAFRVDSALVSIALGIAASLVAAWLPARAASRLNPVLALHNIETRQREAVLGWPRMVAGLALTTLGLVLVRFAPPRVGNFFQFAYVAMILFGLVIILPRVAQWLARALRPLMDRAFGSEGVLAVDTMIHAPRRTSATVSALMVGLTFVFGTGAYVNSYQRTVVRWMDRSINSDLYVTTSLSTRSRTYHFSEALGQRIAALPSVKRVENVRFTFVPYRDDEVALISIEIDGWLARARDPLDEGDEDQVRELMPRGQGVLVSRNFATRWGIGTGDRLQLNTPTGLFDQPILGLVEDYSSEKGVVYLDRVLYKQYWRDNAVDFVDVNLKPGVERVAAKREIERLIVGEQRAFVYTNEEYKNWVLSLINQFFTLNYIQMVVAMLVAVIGIVNTLIISVSERRREIGVLRAIGSERRQVRKMVLLEAAAMAIIGVIMGAVGGVLSTYFLVRIAAVLYAGFTIPFTFPLSLIVMTLPLVVVIALVAAWWPARRAVQLNVVEAIGYE
ncbi:MAG: FtsX-like permease family protein [Acidobacteria bacterium]|nr:FtsX-like permease family protein [Acidobacteriota bacterium]